MYRHQFIVMYTKLVCICALIAIVIGYPENSARPPISDEDLDATLQDRRYLQRQLKCALGEAACDPVGRRLKSLAPLVLQGNCPQCTPQETRQIRKVLSYVQTNFPKEWNKILLQYSG